MLTSGDVVELDLGAPAGREAGFRHPAIVVTAQRILDAAPTVVHVVPLTSTDSTPSARRCASTPTRPTAWTARRPPSASICVAVSTGRVDAVRGNVGAAVLSEVREVIAVILDLPT